MRAEARDILLSRLIEQDPARRKHFRGQKAEVRALSWGAHGLLRACLQAPGENPRTRIRIRIAVSAHPENVGCAKGHFFCGAAVDTQVSARGNPRPQVFAVAIEERESRTGKGPGKPRRPQENLYRDRHFHIHCFHANFLENPHKEENRP